MFHRLSTLAAVASLVLCVATCVLWVRSYRTGFVVRYVTAGGYGACVGSIPGVLGTGVEAGPPPPPTGPRWVAGWLRWNSGRTRHDRLTSGDVQPPGGVYGFYAERRLAESDRRSPGWERRALAGWYADPEAYTASAQAPAWSVAAVLAMLPMARVVARVRGGRQTPAGICPACGYDLRATPGRCPECGAESTTRSETTHRR